MSDRHIVWEQNHIRIWSNGEISISDYIDYYSRLNAEETRKFYEALRKYYRKSKREKARE